MSDTTPIVDSDDRPDHDTKIDAYQVLRDAAESIGFVSDEAEQLISDLAETITNDPRS